MHPARCSSQAKAAIRPAWRHKLDPPPRSPVGIIGGVDLELVAAEWEAGLLAPERVPAIAVALMEAGFDSPSLRVAAGLLPGETADAHDLFSAVLGEH